MRIILVLVSMLVMVGCAWAGPRLCLQWDAPTEYEDGTPIDATLSYKLYDWDGQAWIFLLDAGTNTTLCTTNLAGFHMLSATAIANGFESEHSESLAVRVSAPAAPLNLKR